MKKIAWILLLSLASLSAFAQRQTSPLPAEQKARLAAFLSKMRASGQQLADTVKQAPDACVSSGDATFTQVISSATCPIDLDVDQSFSETPLEEGGVTLPRASGRFKMAVKLPSSDLQSAEGEFEFVTESIAKLEPKPHVVIEFATTMGSTIRTQSEGEVEASFEGSLSFTADKQLELRTFEIRGELNFSDFDAIIQIVGDANGIVSGTLNDEALDAQLIKSMNEQVQQLKAAIAQKNIELPKK